MVGEACVTDTGGRGGSRYVAWVAAAAVAGLVLAACAGGATEDDVVAVAPSGDEGSPTTSPSVSASGDEPTGEAAEDGISTASDEDGEPASSGGVDGAGPVAGIDDLLGDVLDREPVAVLSACTPSPSVDEQVLVPVDGSRPPLADLEAVVEERGDLRELVESRQYEGVSYEDALHDAYAQVVSNEVFGYAQERWPGYVTGRVAMPSEGQPFEVVVEGPVPTGVDLSDVPYLSTFGLVVTGGGGRPDEAAFEALALVAMELDARVVDIDDDPVGGRILLETGELSAEHVAALEAAVPDPSRLCIVQVEPDILCDRSVVAAATARSERRGEVVPGTPASAEEAEVIVRSHLGLSADESRAKAEAEDRPWRTSYVEGWGGVVTADGAPGRITVDVCLGTVVDGSVEQALGG